MNEFKFSCPDCGQHIQCDELWSGRQIHCPACQQPLVVPSLGPPVIEAPAATGPRITQKPPGKKVKYYRYEDVPWYRRSTLNHNNLKLIGLAFRTRALGLYCDASVKRSASR